MSPTKRVGLAGAVALMLTGGSYADTTPDGVTNDELRGRVAELEATVAELKAGQGDNWLTEQRADEIRGLVQDVLADADTRASLLTQGMTAGYDDGFVLSNRDGSFSMKINGQIQFRHVTNSRDSSSGDPVDTHRGGFENTRTKLVFTGNVISQDWRYKIEGNFARGSGEGDFRLEDSWLEYALADNWRLKFGQYKAPLLREELVDSRYQLAVERSLVNEIFTADRVQGVEIGYYGDMFRGWFSYNDGTAFGTVAGGSNGAWSAEDVEIAFTLRGEGLLMGNWDEFNRMTSPEGTETGFLLGGAIAYQKGEYGTTGGPLLQDNELEIWTLTFDGTFNYSSLVIYGAFIYRDIEQTTPGAATLSEYGIVVQAGYYLNPKWELFGRFEYADLDLTGVDDITILTFGFNHYMDEDPNVKLSVDVGVSFDTIPDFGPGGIASGAFSSVDADITGYQTDSTGEDGQVVLRAQWQLLF